MSRYPDGEVHTPYPLTIGNVLGDNGETADEVHVLALHPKATSDAEPTQTEHAAVQDENDLSTWHCNVPVADEPGTWSLRINMIKDSAIAGTARTAFWVRSSNVPDPTATP